jgi:hypothetical protein
MDSRGYGLAVAEYLTGVFFQIDAAMLPSYGVSGSVPVYHVISQLLVARECLTVRGQFEAGVGAFATAVQTAHKSSSQSNSALGGCTLPSPGLDDRPASAASNAPISQLAGLRPSGGRVKSFREIWHVGRLSDSSLNMPQGSGIRPGSC